MNSPFPSAQEYSKQTARYAALTVVDIRSEQALVTEPYRNQVLVDVNHDCMRLSVFEGEYPWHHHPDSDEFFLVVSGTLEIDFMDRHSVTLSEWQSIVVPAGTMHRTRGIGRTVNVTYEKRGAQTVFLEPK
ncbi:MAG TPA: cupin domain-containing protein [Steroidobacteraceae bacterium]|jgi:mannose-6-phosphate isomerase-like protein (cupin superfamily)